MVEKGVFLFLIGISGLRLTGPKRIVDVFRTVSKTVERCASEVIVLNDCAWWTDTEERKTTFNWVNIAILFPLFRNWLVTTGDRGNLQLTSVFVSQFTVNYNNYIYGNVLEVRSVNLFRHRHISHGCLLDIALFLKPASSHHDHSQCTELEFSLKKEIITYVS